eukprot:Hpha_TRINITY_DN16046_c5_g5::TRINITY_DN16046_c5_g5_i2::g.117986::m.117986/K05303/K05303; O-methyltransferase
MRVAVLLLTIVGLAHADRKSPVIVRDKGVAARTPRGKVEKRERQTQQAADFPTPPSTPAPPPPPPVPAPVPVKQLYAEAVGIKPVLQAGQQVICTNKDGTDASICADPSMEIFPYKGLFVQELYLKTLRQSILGVLTESPALHPGGGSILPERPFVADGAQAGLIWPKYGISMVGKYRIDRMHELLHEAYRHRGLKGDFLEAGVWRGGSSIHAQGFLTAYGLKRRVWVCDSFRGLPPNTDFREDPINWNAMSFLEVSQDQVKDNFKRYDLLADNVQFVKGYFSDSLPKLRASGKIEKIALMRLDGDMYMSTIDIFCSLYDFLEVGGFYYIDDWIILSARHATLDFQAAHGIQDKMHITQDSSVFFEKMKDIKIDEDWCAKARIPKKEAPPTPPPS